MKVLGAACKVNSTPSEYITDMHIVRRLVEECDTLVCHNAQYDIGILHMLNIPYKGKTIVDTKLLAKCYNNNLFSYSLDPLLKKFLGQQKESDALGEYVMDHPELFSTVNRPDKEDEKYEEKYKRQHKKANKIAITHMDIIQENNFELVSKYANQDANGTYDLYKHLITKVTIDIGIFSDLIKLLIQSRARGIRVDINRAKEVSTLLETHSNVHRDKVYEMCGQKFNLNPSKEFYEILSEQGVSFPLTEKGNYSCTKEFIDSSNNEILKNVSLSKKYMKAKNDYVDKIVDMCVNIKDGYGYVHPEFIVFGAKTGRFSCKSPNIQQIPKRDKVVGPLCRSIFIPHENEKWYSFDYSSQEPRLLIHYAAAVNPDRVRVLCDMFNKRKDIDIYEFMAGMANVDRDTAKTLYLGLTYGMGVGKLSSSLNVGFCKARDLIKKFKDGNMYISVLDVKVQNKIQNKGHIKSLLRRNLTVDKDFEYKALNMLIQGGAADQTIRAMVECYRKNIPVLFTVHDEINCSLTSEKQAATIKDIMENSTELNIPSLVECGSGNSWEEAK